MTSPEERIRYHLAFLYGEKETDLIWPQLQARLAGFRERYPRVRATALPPSERLSEQDSVLITYGDQIRESGRPPLESLGRFLKKHLRGL